MILRLALLLILCPNTTWLDASAPNDLVARGKSLVPTVTYPIMVFSLRIDIRTLQEHYRSGKGAQAALSQSSAAPSSCGASTASTCA